MTHAAKVKKKHALLSLQERVYHTVVLRSSTSCWLLMNFSSLSHAFFSPVATHTENVVSTPTSLTRYWVKTLTRPISTSDVFFEIWDVNCRSCFLPLSGRFYFTVSLSLARTRSRNPVSLLLLFFLIIFLLRTLSSLSSDEWDTEKLTSGKIKADVVIPLTRSRVMTFIFINCDD